jgi:uncharacterized protein YndB with AHSA1/START domain
MSSIEQDAEQRSTTHSTFVIERTYDASPQRVFDAWADPAAKAKWFGPAEKGEYSLEFRVGGREHMVAQAGEDYPRLRHASQRRTHLRVAGHR